MRDHTVLQLWGRRWRYGAAQDRAAEHLVGLRGTALAMGVATLTKDPTAITAYPVITRCAREARQTCERAVRAPAA